MSSAFSDKKAPPAAPQQQAPDTNVPCLDWVGTNHARFVCTHCNRPAQKGIKKYAAYFIVCFDHSGQNTVLRVPRAIADSVAEMLLKKELINGSIIQRVGDEIIVTGVQAGEYGNFQITDTFLAANLDNIPTLPEASPLIFRICPGWHGLTFLLYHPNTLLSPLDLEAKNHGYDLSKIHEITKRVHGESNEGDAE